MSNQGHTKRSPLLSKEERQEWNEQKKCRRRYLDTAEEDYQEEARERKVGKKEEEKKKNKDWENEKIEEGIRSSQKMSFERQNLIQRWDSSQIENEEEGEESWQEGDQMEEEQHLDDLIERRRMEGSSLKLDVMQKFPELVVNKRMSQGEQGKATKEKKKVPGWSFEEMKERPNIAAGGGYSRDEKMEKSKPQ